MNRPKVINSVLLILSVAFLLFAAGCSKPIPSKADVHDKVLSAVYDEFKSQIGKGGTVDAFELTDVQEPTEPGDLAELRSSGLRPAKETPAGDPFAIIIKGAFKLKEATYSRVGEAAGKSIYQVNEPAGMKVKFKAAALARKKNEGFEVQVLNLESVEALKGRYLRVDRSAVLIAGTPEADAAIAKQKALDEEAAARAAKAEAERKEKLSHFRKLLTGVWTSSEPILNQGAFQKTQNGLLSYSITFSDDEGLSGSATVTFFNELDPQQLFQIPANYTISDAGTVTIQESEAHMVGVNYRSGDTWTFRLENSRLNGSIPSYRVSLEKLNFRTAKTARQQKFIDFRKTITGTWTSDAPLRWQNEYYAPGRPVPGYIMATFTLPEADALVGPTVLRIFSETNPNVFIQLDATYRVTGIGSLLIKASENKRFGDLSSSSYDELICEIQDGVLTWKCSQMTSLMTKFSPQAKRTDRQRKLDDFRLRVTGNWICNKGIQENNGEYISTKGKGVVQYLLKMPTGAALQGNAVVFFGDTATPDVAREIEVEYTILDSETLQFKELERKSVSGYESTHVWTLRFSGEKLVAAMENYPRYKFTLEVPSK